MAIPKIFVSSTCYDFVILRTELRSFIETLGYEPVMSEYSDVLYDYRVHTQSSCLQEIPNCDMVIFIIGGRYGGKSIPQALDLLDIEKLKEKGPSTELLENKKDLSITQLEFLKSIQTGIPVFTFVDTGVMNDYEFWKRNKENGINNKIEYPHIEKQETAKYIFNFIDYIGSLHNGNSIASFSNLDNIKNHLRKQWAALFQRFLKEQRDKVQADILKHQNQMNSGIPKYESKWQREKNIAKETELIKKSVAENMKNELKRAGL